MPLALFSPLPRPVMLAGKVYRVRPLRIRDLFALADLAAGEPPGVPEGADAGALKAAFDAAEAWPGSWADALRMPAGTVAVLGACLRDERLSVEELAQLAGQLNPAEWRRVMAIVFGSDPACLAAAAIDAAIGVEDAAEGVPWPEAVAKFWEAHPMPEEALLDVSVTMLKLAATGGERNVVNPDSSAESQARRFAFWNGADRN